MCKEREIGREKHSAGEKHNLSGPTSKAFLCWTSDVYTLERKQESRERGRRLEITTTTPGK